MGFLLGTLLLLAIVGMAIVFGISKDSESDREKLTKLEEEVKQLRQEQEKLKKEKRD